MKIQVIKEVLDCSNVFPTKTIVFENNIVKNEIFKISYNRKLIFNENLDIPYFKIIDKMFIIRGALHTNRMTIEFTTNDKIECDYILEKLINQITTIN
ncbi:hypothetical protein SDC9_146452 [bioreactor metagenome]|uniref:Uncharacterized protein n=1 Tax=bioreactor metagenome TaxID=1076179 RepID=A0A645ED30_9ZZZZ